MGVLKKIGGALSFVWKNNKIWLLVSCITMVVIFTASMVATQVAYLSGTINLLLGGERNVLVSGDPSQYQRYKADEGIESKKDAFDAGNLLNERIAEEGIVLLKNENNALPIATSANSKAKISVFGKNSVNLVYGGSGSGGKGAEGATDLYTSLTDAHFDVNQQLKNFYSGSDSGSGRPSNPAMGTIVRGLGTGETPLSRYENSSIDGYIEDYKDAALVVFSRVGGEGWDLPRTMLDDKGYQMSEAKAGAHYLQLDNNEEALLKAVCSSTSFNKVIIIINSNATMELGFLNDPTHELYSDKIQAALWIGSLGTTGTKAVGRILSGSVNPSGRLVDTYARSFFDMPTVQNFADNFVPGSGSQASGNEYVSESGAKRNQKFVEYEESIYIGYRYYETRGYTENDNGDWYEKNVVYPFGHGLSYSTFEWTVGEAKLISADGSEAAMPATLTENDKDKSVSIDVKVKNTDGPAGKEVVQLYYTPQYITGGIEKSHVVLGDFKKTDTIAAGGEETVTLKIKLSDMSSYDYMGSEAYVLDQGNYTLRVGKNAHDCWAGGITANEKTFELTERVVYDTDTATGTEIKNRFDDVNAGFKDFDASGRATLMSRTDFEGTMPKAPTGEEREVSEEFLDGFTVDSYIGRRGNRRDKDKKWYTEVEYEQSNKTLSENEAKIKLYAFIKEDGSVDFDDNELWDEFLNQLTIKQLAGLIGKGAFNTQGVQNIEKPSTIDADGPAGFVNFMSVGAATPLYDTCFYSSECVIGSTWSKTLAYEMGKAVGNEGLFGDERNGGTPYSGWYSPAVNIHRTPFSGRNFEYYSEDGLLSGIMGANVVAGAKEKGVYTYVKHFVLNDQETDRGGVSTWATEQAMREIYFKPFELTVKEGKATAMMSAFNRIGKIWVGGSYELLTEILRDEWGFKGMVISDFNTGEAHMPADQMIRAGGDLNLSQDIPPSTNSSSLTTTQISCMRKAVKNILYTVAGSNAMNGRGDGVRWAIAMPVWMVWLIVINIVLFVGFAVWGFFAIRHSLKKAKSNE